MVIKMFDELETIVLTINLPQHRLITGDLGTVVLIHAGGAGYEVEFTDMSGKTLAVVTLDADQVRRAASGEIAHVRQVST
jgi:hypothetical protein